MTIKQTPKVSVIVPAYNSIEYINDCIQSIIDQTYENIEIIIIDDASTDHTIKVLEEYKERIHVIQHKENEGPGKSRNSGVDYSSGDLIVFVDSDDYLSSHSIIEDMVKEFSGDICLFNGKSINEKREIIKDKYYWLDQQFLNEYSIFKINNHLLFGIVFPYMKVYSSLFLKSNHIRFPEGIYGEDVEFWFRCLLATKKIKYFHKDVYCRRIHGGSIMNKESIKNVKDRIDNLDSLLSLTSNNAELNNYITDKYISFITYLAFLKNDTVLFSYMDTKIDWLKHKYGINPKKHWDRHLASIASILYQRTSVIHNPGLLNGLTGITVFFFHYAQYKNNSDIEDFAMSLIERVQEKIHNPFQVDYSSGITGIGVGFDYLMKNNFVEGDSDEVLEAIDKILSQYIVCEEHLYCNVLSGIMRYFILRIDKKNEDVNTLVQISNKINLIHLVDIIDNMPLLSWNLQDLNNLLLQIDRLNIYPTKVQQLLNKLYCVNPDLRIHQAENFQLKKITEIYHGLFEESNTEYVKQYDQLSPGLHGLAGIGLYLMSLIDNTQINWHILL